MTHLICADAVAAETLLRCWVRETALSEPSDGVLRVECAPLGVSIEAPVLYWSPAGLHRLGPATLGTGRPVGATTIADLLAIAAGAGPAHAADLVARVADSVRRVRDHLEQPLDLGATAQPFLAAEQALLAGHPLHPAPKARAELTDTEAAAFSPELHGAFPLRWFAAHRSIVAMESALDEPVPSLVGELAPRLQLGPDEVPVPLHPRQAADLLARPHVMEMLERGVLRDLGQRGECWHPTSSLRTVYRADARFMVKLSLAVRITNSRRENLRKELRRGVEVCRMLAAGLGRELAAAHPRFSIVRDVAWVAIEGERGMDAVLRENPFGAGARVECLAGLTALDPRTGRSRLGGLIAALASGSGLPVAGVAEEWFRRYLETVPAAVLWLYATHGIGLESHQQNTLVGLDDRGWPETGWYRDNQGYYFAESRSAELCRWASNAGEESETLCADAVIDERLTYYLGINNVLGLIGALGSEGLADERVLLRTWRRFLERAPRSAVVEALLDGPTLRSKGNLLTRLEGMDELVGPLETQSVYRPIPNPLVAL